MKNPNTKDGRSRKLFKFHLDIARHDDYELMEYIEDWKATREFLPSLRKAFWLFVSLLAGSIELLIEYFPGIVASIRQDAIAELEAENAALRATIEAQNARLEQLQKQADKPQSASIELETYIQQIADGVLARMPVSVEATPDTAKQGQNRGKFGGLQPLGNSGGLNTINLSNTALAAPVFDEDDTDLLQVETRKDTGNTAAMNFLNSMKALQGKD